VGDRHGRGEEKRDIAAPATIAMATIGFIMSSPKILLITVSISTRKPDKLA
jgi:hypothetical protein